MPNCANAKSNIGIELNVGLASLGDHTDVVEDAYEADSSGLGLGFELGLAVPIVVGENVVIRPALSYLFTSVSIERQYCSYYGGCRTETESYADSILLPAIGAEYHINGAHNDGFFIGGELSMPQPSSGSNIYDFDGDGLGFGIFGGYNSKSGALFRVGYRSIPVNVTYYGLIEESKNFGGITFMVAYRFYGN
ncbi:MAG: hypothetical protein LBU73_03420 [Helicobacteraceae bacterium]|nr:hypothetical protein [Helicobacteraceae bacterium]